MSRPSNIPQDVWDRATKAHAEFADSRVSDNLSVIIARAIIEDRARRAQPAVGGITPDQRRVLEFVRTFIGMQGVSPTYEEIKAGLGFASKSSVSKIVHQLDRRGAIALLPNSRRAISLPH